MTRVASFAVIWVVGCAPPGEPGDDASTGAASTTMTTTSLGGSETGAGPGSTSVPTTSGDEVTSAGEVDTGMEGSTGGGSLCDGAAVGFSAELEPLDVPDVPDCGTIELLAFQTANPEPGVFEVDACGCEPICESPIPWRLTMQGPPEVLPLALPKCIRVVYEREFNAAHTGCEFTALSLWDGELPGSVGVYHAATRVLPTAAAADVGWQVESLVNEGCACDECCRPAALLDLAFGFADAVLVQLTEGHESLADVDALAFRFFGLRSHDAGRCDETEEVDWVIRGEF